MDLGPRYPGHLPGDGQFQSQYLQNDNSFLNNLKHKFRLIVMNDSSLEEQISFRFSGIELITAISIAAILLFFVFLLLVGYTPLNEFVPGKASNRLHKELIAITLKTDSLEKRKHGFILF